MRAANVRARLIAVPSAGGTPSMYRSLADRLAPDVEVWAVQLPGRERRFGEPVPESLAEIVPALATAIGDTIEPPFAILGHSMGALIAYEVARRLCDLGEPPPQRLLVSAFPAPHLPLWSAQAPRHTLPDEELLRWLAAAGGMPAEALADRELMALLLPSIRGDLRACESYAYRPAPPLPMPVTAFAGSDDALVPVEHVAAWDRHTDGDFDLNVLPGGHFYLHTAEHALASRVRDVLAPGIP
ncbi:thioesterase II family protein [Couchioplanes caeruleus]|uniref:Thioesterase n=2 Tax=Couchioplanes caeruleus TaxID=56438 RepID=A0A1K0FSF6_9ACTN|nr:alpha/beta fold hydrolase [Couchioplanes caeruleus]OJF15783.1 Thioesterase [Couchioplanes caeruleus subsp. caeruleus]